MAKKSNAFGYGGRGGGATPPPRTLRVPVPPRHGLSPAILPVPPLSASTAPRLSTASAPAVDRTPGRCRRPRRAPEPLCRAGHRSKLNCTELAKNPQKGPLNVSNRIKRGLEGATRHRRCRWDLRSSTKDFGGSWSENRGLHRKNLRMWTGVWRRTGKGSLSRSGSGKPRNVAQTTKKRA